MGTLSCGKHRNKMAQLTAYADDIDIIAINMKELGCTVRALNQEMHRRLLERNGQETKYMVVSKKKLTATKI